MPVTMDDTGIGEF